MKVYCKLPFRFDPELLYKDLLAVEDTWNNHFNTGYYEGRWSGITLTGPEGTAHSLSPGHTMNGSVKHFIDYQEIPYTASVLDTLECPKLSVRYLKLDAGARIKAHKDKDLGIWRKLVRLHIPVLTNPKVVFLLDGNRLNMKPGECWYGDFSKTHSVSNNGDTDRIHLVIDCKINDWLRVLFEKEGILEVGEQAPDPLDAYSKEAKVRMVQSFLDMGTDTALKMASDLISKHDLEDHFKDNNAE